MSRKSKKIRPVIYAFIAIVVLALLIVLPIGAATDWTFKFNNTSAPTSAPSKPTSAPTSAPSKPTSAPISTQQPSTSAPTSSPIPSRALTAGIIGPTLAHLAHTNGTMVAKRNGANPMASFYAVRGEL